MPEKRSSWDPNDGEVTQRAIVLQVLREDHDERWTRTELEAEILDIDPATINDALTRLHAEGIVHLHGEHVQASRAALHLDDLGMVSI